MPMKIRYIFLTIILLLTSACGGSGSTEATFLADRPYVSKKSFNDAVIEAKDEKGQYIAQVSNDGKSVRVIKPNNEVLWQTDVSLKYGQLVEGEPLIRKISIARDYVQVIFGSQAVLRVDLDTGTYIDLTEANKPEPTPSATSTPAAK